MSKAAEILKRAIENWETKGWLQHSSRNAAGASCSSGGIKMATFQLGLFDTYRHYEDASIAFRTTIREDSGNRSHSIISWNDEPGRTKEDVILAAKKTIERLEANDPKV